MKILYITQYFPPEIGAGAARAFNISNCLSGLEHKVRIISEIPNYPDGKIAKKYRNRILYNEKFKGINVLRTYACASNRDTFLKKMLFYLSFMISSCVGALCCKKPDLIIATSPPLLVALTGYFISRVKKTKLLLDIRDIWPDSAVAVGALRHRTILYFISKKLERFLYNRANLITSSVYGLCERIRKSTKTPVFHLPNTVLLTDFKPGYHGDRIKQKYGLNGKFIVLYSGNHGLAQGLEFILQSALLLKRFEDILFLFVGEGVKKVYLEEQKRGLGLNNVIFLGKKTHKEMPDIINISNVCLVPLKKNELFLNALPSKILEYMALQKPIILSVKGEAEKFLKDADAGISIEPEDSEKLSEAILKLYRNPELCRLFGKNGYRYIKNFYSHQNQFTSCKELLKSL